MFNLLILKKWKIIESKYSNFDLVLREEMSLEIGKEEDFLNFRKEHMRLNEPQPFFSTQMNLMKKNS